MNKYGSITLLERIAHEAEINAKISASEIRAAEILETNRIKMNPLDIRIRPELKATRSRSTHRNTTGIPSAMLKQMSTHDLLQAMRV